MNTEQKSESAKIVSTYRRRTDFTLARRELDGIADTENRSHLAGLIYLDVQIGDDCISGWVRPEVARKVKAAFVDVPRTDETAFPITEEHRGQYACLGLTKREHIATALASAIITGAVARGCPHNEWYDALTDGRELADRLLRVLSK